ncbi:MAG: metallopeptidase family protein [Actinomycetota bacterium]|nr:metallopeptidase family protein [Actinomycetota bacterium]MDH4352518.1 metallopeptidase family protein [Actinomycetota bacterium]MDH5279335.1 metallopeptidase family protein [Actinomycetota bacterium]
MDRPPASTPAGWGAARRRRDRHGRGLRGPLAPTSVPLSRSRSAAFDDLVLATVDRVAGRLPDALAGRIDLDRVEVVVADLPDHAASDAGAGVAMGGAVAAGRGAPARIVVYRRPVETRSTGGGDLERLVRRVVVEQVAALLGVSAEEVDPGHLGS